MYTNEFEKNKRVYPFPNNPGIPTALKAGTDATGGKGPGQDGWESVDGVVEGPVQAINSMNNEGPIQRTKRIIAQAESLRLVPRHWPDSGMAMPDKKAPVDFEAVFARGLAAQKASASDVYPREVGEDGVVRDKKIHQFGLDEDPFEATSIDQPDDDDMNDYGGMGKELAEALAAATAQYEDEDVQELNRDEIGTDAEDLKYGPGNYPTEADYRTEGFYSNLFGGKNKEKQPLVWLIPGVLAAGPHPIFTSHLDNLEPLMKAGIKAIVSVHDKPLDLKYFEDTKLAHLFVATVEGFSSDLQRVCKFIETQEVLGNPVFVHSFTGKGRAATVLAAYMMHKNWLTGHEEAIKYVRQYYHRDAIETAYQEDALMKFSLDA